MPRKLITLAYLMFFCVNVFSQVKSTDRIYEIWDNQPAPNRGQDYTRVLAGGFPVDPDWEAHSYPIGNGYMGANLFGRTDIERIQITNKTLANSAMNGRSGITNFAEVFLDFGHYDVDNYKRSLNLNEAISYVSYEHKGISYSREYFANYPSNVIVIKLSANKKASLSFSLKAVIPYLRSKGEKLPKFGTVTALDNTITLSGNVPSHNINYEGQIKVINDGGKLIAENGNGAEIRIVDANSATILISTGTNYRLSDRIFLTDDVSKKLDPSLFPHEQITKSINHASALGFENLKKQHLKDYQGLFSRVSLKFSPAVTIAPTKTLVENYKKNPSDVYLEELMFHFGRYLLIASSRKGTLPCGLQGVWSQYHVTPWSGGYWHNINVQMNYWGAFSANLTETFEAYEEYFNAYLPKAHKNADEYIKAYYPNNYSKTEKGNGWCIG
ncbi:MAG TPA: glycoside hydrolase family 95 protein, partial [Pelobium sp.]|nr:glycoside hydrolase family 95 protein [Pelobium sp.]